MNVTHIICVDDERPVLDSVMMDIDKVVSAFDEKYKTQINVEGCLSGRECLQVLDQCDSRGEDVACILTDIRMPGMKGDELITLTSKTHPRAGKIILTGYSDLDAAVNSINASQGLLKYLRKPYETVTLQKAVDYSLDYFFKDRSPSIYMGGILFKEIETKHELEEVFRLAYEIYVSELGRFKENKLTEEQREKKQKWDHWDFRVDTRQIIALKGGNAIGRVRIIYGDIPLQSDFDSSEQLMQSWDKSEVSKLMIKKEFRGAGLYIGLMRFVYHYVKDSDSVFISNLPKLEKFYNKIGFQNIGEFYNNELDDTYLAMHVKPKDFISEPENLIDVGLDPLFRKMIMVPIPRNKMEDWFLQAKSGAVAMLHKLGIGGEF